MKKTGMTLIEAVVTIALLGVIFTLVTPLIRSFGQVKNRVYTQKSIDREFSNINEFIQKKIRSAKRTSKDTGSGEVDFEVEYVGVFDIFIDSSTGFFTTGETGNKLDDGEEGKALFLEIPSSSTDSDFVFLYFQDNQLFYQEGFDPPVDDENTNPVVIMDGVEGYFKLREGVVQYYIDIILDPENEGKFRTSLRSSAATRIDIEI